MLRMVVVLAVAMFNNHAEMSTLIFAKKTRRKRAHFTVDKTYVSSSDQTMTSLDIQNY